MNYTGRMAHLAPSLALFSYNISKSSLAHSFSLIQNKEACSHKSSQEIYGNNNMDRYVLHAGEHTSELVIGHSMLIRTCIFETRALFLTAVGVLHIRPRGDARAIHHFQCMRCLTWRHCSSGPKGAINESGRSLSNATASGHWQSS